MIWPNLENLLIFGDGLLLIVFREKQIAPPHMGIHTPRILPNSFSKDVIGISGVIQEMKRSAQPDQIFRAS